MKIALVAQGEVENPKTWSGTPYRILEKLKQNSEFEISNISYDKYNSNILIKILRKIFSKLHCIGTYRQPGFAWYYRARFKKDLERIKPAKCLFISEHSIDESFSKDTDYYAYVDASLKPMMQYDKYGTIAKMTYSIYEKSDRTSLLQMKKIFTQNEWARNFLINTYGISSDKIINVHFGINVDILNEEKDYSKHLLLIVLRKGVEHKKGLDLLLEAFPKVKAAVPDVRLAVVGTSEDYCRMDGVDYYYNMPRAKTKELFKECTLYTMPAISEPNGITYLEALANKAPIVGLNRYSIPEFTGNGKYGFISKEDDADSLANIIIDALSNKNRLKKMGEEGQKFVEANFNWDNTLDAIMNNMLK